MGVVKKNGKKSFVLAMMKAYKKSHRKKEKPNEISLGLTQRERFELSVGY